MARRRLWLLGLASSTGALQAPLGRGSGWRVAKAASLEARGLATAASRLAPNATAMAVNKKGEESRRLKRVQQEDDESRVSVYAVGEEVDCEALLAALDDGLVRRVAGVWEDAMLEDAVHSSIVSEATRREVFVFEFGCVVLWGFSRRQEREIVGGLLAADKVQGTVLAAERVEAHDTFRYVVDGSFGCKRDVVRLQTEDILEKFSVAYAMAQSARLFVWEARVSATINEIQDIPKRLAETGRTELDENEISMMIGKVFLERAQVNLASDILDSPDFLWEDDLHEPQYRRVYEWLDVPDRVTLLNQRLDVMKDLLDVLNTQLTNNHSSRLELIVIVLIAVEIFVTIATFALDRLLPVPTRGL